MPENTAAREYILPVSPARFVVLHYHIFKNAGSTVEYALQRTFGNRFATLHGPDANAILSSGDVAPFLLNHPKIVAISSHHLKYPKPVAPGIIVFDLCMLREPLDRLWSMYQHFRRADPVDDLSRKAQEMDARSFFDFLLENHPHLVNDVQVNVLANGAAYTRPPDSVDLAAALKVAREMSAIGVVDLFDESLVAAEYFLCPAFPGIRLEYVKQNVSPPRGPEERFREAVGDCIYQQLSKMNQLDAELVSWATGEVRRRFDLAPNALERLAAFRERCEELRAATEPAPDA
ncbi:MAG: hypothetical protein LAP39_03380 [Acidobacteriia bacterium]|nr:hypothetical protein [Terriglobia bacterium]